MTRSRPLLTLAACAGGLAIALALPPAEAAPSRGGGHYGGHSGGHAHSGGHGYWGWRWGVAIGVPWALGVYDPWYWGPRYGYYAPYYARAPYYACEQDEDCWRERRAQAEPVPPTTQVAPSAAMSAAPAPLPVPAETPAGGAPTQRPLHLNYCEASRAWYPAVTSCASGWRMTRPAYD